MRQWYALRSKPKKETTAVSMLVQAQIETFLPLVAAPGCSAQSGRLVPFFPSYFFASLDASKGEFRMARFARGVAGILSYGGEPCPVPEDLIALIRERLARTESTPRIPEFNHGDRVAIASGPLAGVEAIFERELSASGRVQVLLMLLHGLFRADVHVSQITLLSKAACPSWIAPSVIS